MKHLIIFLLPVLMFLDYFMTIINIKLARKKYTEHFIIEQLELNTVWQKDVNKERSFNIKHVILVLFLNSICYLIFGIYNKPYLDMIFPYLYGALLMVWSVIISTHIGNFLTYKYLINHPESVEGSIK